MNFLTCIESGKSPSEWKKANVFPVRKKSNKKTSEDYRPVSLLPICGKVFEVLIYNRLFELFISNEKDKVVFWRKNIFLLPSGSCGKRYTGGKTRLFNE